MFYIIHFTIPLPHRISAKFSTQSGNSTTSDLCTAQTSRPKIRE